MSARGLAAGVLLLASAWMAAAAPDPYATRIALSNLAPGAPTTLAFVLRASGDRLEPLTSIEVWFPEGTELRADALGPPCVLEGRGPRTGGVCGRDHPEARIGAAELTIDLVGVYTLRGDAFRVTGAPQDANLLLSFPPGQVFGVGAQSIFGMLSEDSEGRVELGFRDLQAQLELPWGATGEIQAVGIDIAGAGGAPPLRNPREGRARDGRYRARIAWKGGGQTQVVRPAGPGPEFGLRGDP